MMRKKRGGVQEPSDTSKDVGREINQDYLAAFFSCATTNGAVWCQKAPFVPPAMLSTVGQLVQ